MADDRPGLLRFQCATGRLGSVCTWPGDRYGSVRSRKALRLSSRMVKGAFQPALVGFASPAPSMPMLGNNANNATKTAINQIQGR